MRNDAGGSPPLGLWALALGAVGFACGFFGPIALNPGANQGPLLGIFITGPGGALFELVAGAVAPMLPLTAGQRWRALGALCIASALGILFFCRCWLKAAHPETAFLACVPPKGLQLAPASWAFRVW